MAYQARKLACNVKSYGGYGNIGCIRSIRRWHRVAICVAAWLNGESNNGS